MGGVFFLASMVFGWALGCGLLYAFLRWLNVRLTPVVHGAGAWAMVVWVVFYVVINVEAALSLPSGHPYRWNLMWGLGAAFWGKFAVGGALLRSLPGRGELWWHDVLFCSLYFGGAFLWGQALLVSWPTTQGPLYEIAQWNGEVKDAHLLMLGAWLFPLGAPLMELLGRNVWRLHSEFAGSE